MFQTSLSVGTTETLPPDKTKPMNTHNAIVRDLNARKSLRVPVISECFKALYYYAPMVVVFVQSVQ